MLINNQFKFFNKKGNNINPSTIDETTAIAIDPRGEGKNAVLKVYSNYEGKIVHLSIIDGGFGYSADTYIQVQNMSLLNTDLTATTLTTFKIDSSYITFTAGGSIQSVDIVSSSLVNKFYFKYPTISGFSAYFLEPVSAGLIQSDSLFLIEKVWEYIGTSTWNTVIDSNIITPTFTLIDTSLVGVRIAGISLNDDTYITQVDLLNQTVTINKPAISTQTNTPIDKYRIGYTHPRVEEYGPFYIDSYAANGTSATVAIATYTTTGNVHGKSLNKINELNLGVTGNLIVGMTVFGNGVPDGTVIKNIEPTIGEVTLNNDVAEGTNISFTFYVSHNLKVGSKININAGPLAGIHTITALSTYTLSFSSTLNSSASYFTYYSVIPQFTASLDRSSDPEWFLYEVEYGTDYPTIQKSKEISFELTDASLATMPDSFTAQNDEWIRIVFEDLEKRLLQINYGIQADVEGSYVGYLKISDTTFSNYSPILLEIPIECEVIAEDERLGLLLENFGRDITIDQELILRDSDINEDNPDYILLNQKRKEMLLQGDQIWPYVGSYKGLVNIINWFGYYDIRIKEYWLNVNADDTYFNRYRQVPITLQLKNKKVSPEQINLLPSKHYKKTNLFGLFYDINRDSGDTDEFGIPITEDAFAYTNEEVLIKLFALKAYLKEKFLPLNTRIVDITGEGVYYERYAINSWSDRNDRLIVNSGKKLDFTYDKKSQIIDLRPYDRLGGLLTPEVDNSLLPYSTYYDINDVIVTGAGGNFYGEIPQVTFPGSAVQQARGRCRVKAMAIASYSITPAGADYQAGDIITLSGGSYEIPFRIEVTAVDVNGSVTDIQINAGPQQGSNYTSLPTTFSQRTVVRPVGNQYEIPVDAIGFEIAATEIPFELQEVTLFDLGKRYATYPTIQFLWDSITGLTPTATLTVKEYESAPISYFNDSDTVKPYSDAPNIPVGALVNVSTTFDVTWDELVYPWNTFTGSNDATLKAWVYSLPAGTGDLIAVEIISQGSDYNFAPTFTVNGGGGFGATVVSNSLRSGKLNIVEYEVQNLSSTVSPGAFNDIITVTPALPAGGLNFITAGKIIKSDTNIPEGTIIDSIIGNDLYLLSYDGSSIATSLSIGDKIYIHQGVSVTAGGVGYTSEPTISPNGGHTSSLYTWAEIGRGDFYQMEWLAYLDEPTVPGTVYNYRSGINTIDSLINHTITLPYTGKYTLELNVYDTNNTKSNAIKVKAVDVYMPEADFAYIAKTVEECKDTWKEFEQIPTPPSDNSFMLSTPNDKPNPVEYTWDNAVGRWVNITFNDTRWDDYDINWDSLSISDLSYINSPTFPTCLDMEILQISSEDVYEGSIISYTDNTTVPVSTINPTITVAGQYDLPKLDPIYDPNDVIYIRRDGVVYNYQVISADYSSPGITKIEISQVPPLAFTQSPTTWEVLREVGGTFVVAGNQIYNEETNPTGLKIGNNVVITKEGNTPVSARNIVSARNADGFDIFNGSTNAVLQKPGAYGRIYKIRDYVNVNGNLVWGPITTSWVFKEVLEQSQQVSDYKGQLILDPSSILINPLNEIRPGFTRIKLYVYDGSELIYKQIFRTVHAYESTSNVGDIYNIFSGNAYVIDVLGISGGKLSELNSNLSSYWSTLASPSIFLEYEYDEFTTQERYFATNGSDETIYANYNKFPANGSFLSSTNFGPSYVTDHTNWFYDHGIVSNSYSMKITNTGVWNGGIGTLVTVDDLSAELYRSDTFFTACQQTFDQDYAEEHLGTRVQTWRNYKEMVWSEFCGNTWDTLDFTDSLWCGYVINNVDSNGGIKFNEYPTFNFQGIIGGMSVAQKYSQALYELNATNNPGVSKFNYAIYGGSISGLYVDNDYSDDYLVSYATQDQISASALNTYALPDAIITKTSALVSPGDAYYGYFVEPATTVTSVVPGSTVDPMFTGYNVVYVDKNIPKKATFVGDTTSGKYVIKNVKGLQSGDLRVGEYLSGDFLPSYPSNPAKVLQLLVRDGKIREIVLDTPLSGTKLNGSFNVEWITAANTFITIPWLVSTITNADVQIIASAKNPSTDNLGYLVGTNGVQFLPPQISSTNISTTTAHTYPVGNYYKWFGYGENRVGAFKRGLQDFLTNYRYAQTYLYEGTSPYGTPGWYPSDDLSYNYSYSNSPTFSNYLEAKAQSERLPYSRAIGGVYTWEETRVGKYNGKLPAGTSVLLSANASDIVGKTQYYWKLIDGETTLAEVIDEQLLWTFEYPGNFDVELTITDTNGNKKTQLKKSFLTIYDSAE
jgi:hypothetical protein